MRTAVIFLSLILAAVVAMPAALATEDNYLMVTVASPPQSQAKTLQAKVTIDAPPNLVWQTITDYPHLKNILPGYEKSNVIRSTGSTKVLDVAMKVAAFLPTYKYQVRVSEMEANRQLKFERISGDFHSLSATYRLVPQDNGKKTLLTYSLSVDTGKNIPGSQGILKSNTEKSLKALERHIETVARRSVIGANQ